MSRILQEKNRKYLWHPYTQMKDYEKRDFLLIDKAKGLLLYDHNGKSYFDTISSWWCILHGHNHPTINQAIRDQVGRLEHVLFAGTSHESAILLAEQLIKLTPSNLTRVFYSDNGSTACEIAIKMSLQFWHHTAHPKRTRIVALERGYHGDTIGAMSLGGVPEFHQPFSELMFDSYRLPSPYCYRCPAGETAGQCSCQCLQPFTDLLAKEGESIAALILEPLIQGAGGLIIYPVTYLQKIADLARQYGIHLILDEVASGFGRTGKMFALEHGNIEPDFLCLSKGLTAGYLPMAATLTTEKIYQAFYDDYGKNKTFYHGHTFTGNPLACAAALASLKVFKDEESLVKLPDTINYLHKKMAKFRQLPWIGDLRQLGMIVAMELVKDKQSKEAFTFTDRVGWHIYLKGLKEGLLLRPMGNVIYLWLPISTTISEIDEIVDRTWRVMSNLNNIMFKKDK